MNEPIENENTDTEIWRERPGDYYSDTLFITIDGALGIDIAGTVFVKPLRKWQELEADNAKLRAALDESIGLQSRYAKLLNMYDDGKRMIFQSSDEWLVRLDHLKARALTRQDKP